MGVRMTVAVVDRAGGAMVVSVGELRGVSGAGREQALTPSNVTMMATDNRVRERGCESVDIGIFYRRCR